MASPDNPMMGLNNLKFQQGSLQNLSPGDRSKGHHGMLSANQNRMF